MAKAIFLDRDGVVNELVYHQEQEIIDSPFTAGQFRLLPGVPEAIKLLRQAGYLVVLTSNQPGIAKGHITADGFEMIKQKMRADLGRGEAYLDGEYYCLHHPQAVVERYRISCECRKPKPGLLLQAARDMHIDLGQSWLVGDNLSDIQAARYSGCQAILLGQVKCELCHLMDERHIRPDYISSNLLEAVRYISDGKENKKLPSILW